MERSILVSLIIIFSLAANAIVPGDTIDVPKGQIGVLADDIEAPDLRINLDTLEETRGTRIRKEGETCFIDSKVGGKVKVISINEGGRVLVEYKAGEALGSMCPSGAKLNVDEIDLEDFQRLADEEKRESAKLIAEIAQLRTVPPKIIEIVQKKATWAKVIKPIKQKFVNGSSILQIGELCALQKGVQIKLVSQTDSGSKAYEVLTKVVEDDDTEAEKNADGTNCPVGTLFIRQAAGE
jgi:hypothetical protein